MSSHPTEHHGIYSIQDLEKHYLKLKPNGHWFEKSTMAFFKSKLNETLYYSDSKIYFISSEKGPNDIRRFSIREYDFNSGDIETFGEFQKYKTLAAAKIAANKIPGVIK